MDEIVVGVDGSDASKKALRWAVEEARLRGTRVVALHAWQPPLPPPNLTPAPVLDVVGLVPEVQKGAEELVREIVAEVVGDEPEVPVDAVAVEGPAATALIEAAREAALLVVGSRGRGGLAALLLGSVSLECAQHAPCPVVIHRGERH
jgi:nucleotide-binding universal stress UspA family protein